MKTKPRLLSVSLAAVLSVSLLIVQPASALTVFDPSNFVQNTLTAVRTLEQINNQINQLQNEAQMLMNQARNLANLDFNIVNRLRSTLATTERLIADGTLNGAAIESLHLQDIVPFEPPQASFDITAETSDLADPGVAEALAARDADMVFHLAGVVSAAKKQSHSKCCD